MQPGLVGITLPGFCGKVTAGRSETQVIVPTRHKRRRRVGLEGYHWLIGSPPHPSCPPPAHAREGVRGCGSDSPRPSQRTRHKRKASQNKIPFVSLPPSQFPGPGPDPSSTLPIPALPGPGTRQTPQQGGVSAPGSPPDSRPFARSTAQFTAPAPQWAAFWSPPRARGADADPTRLPPGARHTTGAHKTHTSRAAARCAPIRPGPAREEGAGRAAGARPRPAAQVRLRARRGGRVTHSMK